MRCAVGPVGSFPGVGRILRGHLAAWRNEGILTQVNYDLPSLARVKEGRKPEPTASVIAPQSVKTSTYAPLTSQGTDAEKEDRRQEAGHPHRHELILAVPVTTASLSENAVGIQLLDQAKKTHPTISKS